MPRSKIENYIKEADCILIGPGLPRPDGQEKGDDDTKELTEGLLKKYPEKKWVIDGGSLQTIDSQFIPQNAILTPHYKEFEKLFHNVILRPKAEESTCPPDAVASGNCRRGSFVVTQDDIISRMAKKYNCTIVLKGPTDIVCSSFDSAQGETRCVRVSGGNAGMTKGGTGDVLAGLTAALFCKNDDPFLVATCASYLNKKAGESLFKRVGYYFNSSDLVDEIPRVMKKYFSDDKK